MRALFPILTLIVTICSICKDLQEPQAVGVRAAGYRLHTLTLQQFPKHIHPWRGCGVVDQFGHSRSLSRLGQQDKLFEGLAANEGGSRRVLHCRVVWKEGEEEEEEEEEEGELYLRYITTILCQPNEDSGLLTLRGS